MIVLEKEYHYTVDSTIYVLKKGTRIDTVEGDFYIVTVNRKKLKLKKSVVENNPDFFKKIDPKTLLIEFLKKINKNSSYAKRADSLMQFFDDKVYENKQAVPLELMETMLTACLTMFKKTTDEKWIKPIHDLGWDVGDDDKLFKKIT